MALEVRSFGDPVLKSKAGKVTSFDDSLAKLAEEMLQTMREYEGVGLAGNQVGRLQRILVAEDEERQYVFVNPEISSRSEERELLAEGCLSIPGIHVDVERPTGVTVNAQDLEGNPFTVEAEGMLARILQHEIDHLDGVLILDRTDRESRRAAMREWRERLLSRP
ncbi:peptide deformylase [Rubrobacter radiotolerans]|uniref:Peptide deformylase n=1 Tax=Rubrobacter radiotolerans TaxID=42256 RepID=A0A023X342_RUBRA|nr:peptide deformylase [Rubrobacter radiotolerans]AHY46758.1 peptide deformylase [Rubrobacter radiotolerans]MDX5894165.1 peptide deformylase [Rubrobacter radiotolerans]SMC05355.1 peptide deformylase [Rubrobacter radiotolerans DSM 5868]